MTPEEIAEKEAETAAAKAKEEAEAKAKAAAEAKPDPLKVELEKVQKKGEGKTELEKLLFSEKKIRERKEQLLKEAGLEPEEDEDDDKPVTVADLKKRDRENAQKTALILADDIEDETERDLVKHHLSNTVRPSGNPKEDLANARAIVNSVKNQQIVEEALRKNPPKRNSSGAGAPAKDEGEIFEPTADEMIYMRPPFNLTQKQIVEARKKAQA